MNRLHEIVKEEIKGSLIIKQLEDEFAYNIAKKIKKEIELMLKEQAKLVKIGIVDRIYTLKSWEMETSDDLADEIESAKHDWVKLED